MLRTTVLVLALSVGLVPFATADELPAPEGRVILTVEGAIERTNAPGAAEFDYGMLAALGLVERVIDSDWADPGTRFEGVPASALMEHVGARGALVEAVAANDFRADVPMSDLTDHPTLFALSMNGERLTLRDKGPVWLVYDDEDRPDVAATTLQARTVWQLTTLRVLE